MHGDEKIMNFDCVLWPVQDEQLEMTSGKGNEGEDGFALVLSAQTNGLKIQAARAVRCGVRMATTRALLSCTDGNE